MVFGDQMRLSSLFYLGISALVVMACGEEEVKKAPKLKKAAKSLPKNGINEDPFQDMGSINGDSQQAEKAVAKEAPTTRLELSENIPTPRQNGDYVLQVGVSDSRVLADILVNKIKRLGYEAYIIQVTDTAQLVGIFYRVRVGYFNTVTDARLFGHNALKPEGIGFWIDNSKNDNIGAPVNSEPNPMEEPKSAEQAPASSDWVEEPKAETTPEPVTNPEPAKIPENPVIEQPASSPTPTTPADPESSPAAPITNTAPQPTAKPATEPVVEKVENDTWDDTPAKTPAPAKKATENWNDDGWN